MKLGRVEGGYLCDVCGVPLTRPHPIIPDSSGKTLRFCRPSNPPKLDDCFVEHFLREYIVQEVERQVRKELKELLEQVCPACTSRLRQFK